MQHYKCPFSLYESHGEDVVDATFKAFTAVSSAEMLARKLWSSWLQEELQADCEGHIDVDANLLQLATALPLGESQIMET